MSKDKKQTPIMGRPDKHEAMHGNKPAEKPDARTMVKRAMARHDLHMSGAEPATEKAQWKLRDELQAALDALDADREDKDDDEDEE